LMIPTERGNPASSRRISPILYSLDTLLPIHGFHQEEAWWPSVEKWDWCLCGPRKWPWGYILELWLSFQVFAGWVLTGLIVAGFTGIVRRE
jgi:hypothetical protein